jgi:GNAT superfamily N-acetyltransferase
MKHSSALIRQATIDDIDILAELLSHLFAIEIDFTTDTEKQKTALRILIESGSAVIYVAEDGNKIVGMVTGQLVISTATGGYSLLLEDMYISKDYRKNGIGSMLISFLESWGAKKNIGRIQLVADRRNISARVFYNRQGFADSEMIGLYKRILEIDGS